MKIKIINAAIKVLTKLSRVPSDLNLQLIKYLPNVSIHKSVAVEEYSKFNISTDCGVVTIKSNVNARRFCTFWICSRAILIIHENVYFNSSCSISCMGKIEIGANTLFGEGVKIYDHNHQFYPVDNKLIVERNRFIIGTVKIGENCWIGSNVTILNNVEIGDNVIIGANSLISQSVPSNSVCSNTTTTKLLRI